MWQQGIYFMSAISVAMSKALAGKKSKAKYMDEPMLIHKDKMLDEENATEEEKQAERDKLLMWLQCAKTTFEANQELREGQTG